MFIYHVEHNKFNDLFKNKEGERPDGGEVDGGEREVDGGERADDGGESKRSAVSWFRDKEVSD